MAGDSLRQGRVGGEVHVYSVGLVPVRKVRCSLTCTPPPSKLIGATLGGNAPWWKFACGGSEDRYTE